MIDIHSLQRQRGAALVVALVLLLVMTVLGVTAMRTTTLQERMAGNLRDSNLAFQSAEAALREAEIYLKQPVLPPFDDSNGLLSVKDGSGVAAYWQAFNWNANSRTSTALANVAAAPRYVIEELPATEPEGGSMNCCALPEFGFFRVTSSAVGGTTDAVTILQTTFRR